MQHLLSGGKNGISVSTVLYSLFTCISKQIHIKQIHRLSFVDHDLQQNLTKVTFYVCVLVCVSIHECIHAPQHTFTLLVFRKNILIFSRRSLQAHPSLSCSRWNPHLAENYTMELKFKPVIYTSFQLHRLKVQPN